MKVYLVWSGSYSDVTVEYVLTDKAEAERISAELDKVDHSRVEEVELDDPEAFGFAVKEQWSTTINLYTGDILVNESRWSRTNYPIQYWERIHGDLQIIYSSVSQDMANKLAAEFRQRVLREYTRTFSGDHHYVSVVWVKNGS